LKEEEEEEEEETQLRKGLSPYFPSHFSGVGLRSMKWSC
jgi:hypothetical protein